MGLNSIFKIFQPKDRVFFQLFESVAEELVKMGEKLKEVVNEPDFDKRAHLIQEIETAAQVEAERHRPDADLAQEGAGHQEVAVVDGRIDERNHE